MGHQKGKICFLLRKKANSSLDFYRAEHHSPSMVGTAVGVEYFSLKHIEELFFSSYKTSYKFYSST